MFIFELIRSKNKDLKKNHIFFEEMKNLMFPILKIFTNN